MWGGKEGTPQCLSNLGDLRFGPYEVGRRGDGGRERRAEITARKGFVLCKDADGASGQLDVS